MGPARSCGTGCDASGVVTGSGAGEGANATTCSTASSGGGAAVVLSGSVAFCGVAQHRAALGNECEC